MNEHEQELTGLELEDILKEFLEDDDDSMSAAEAAASHALQELLDDEDEEEETAKEKVEAPAVSGDTVRLDALVLPTEEPKKESTVTSDTVRLDKLTDDTVRLDKLTDDTVRLDTLEIQAEAAQQESAVTSDTIRLDDLSEIEEAKGSESAEEEPAPAAPPKHIIFDPRARLRELKRKLVAGPERRYYELSEIGVGKLQMAIFLCLVVIAISAGAAVMYAMGLVPDNRQRLMVFGQILAMLLGALLGSYQMLDGLGDLLHGKFTPNTLLAITFFACCGDSLYCLQEQRVPLCAAFTPEVMMSLWATYHKRTTEMGMMDTMRKAVRLDSVVKCSDYHEGKSAILRGEGEVEDLMDHYQEISGPEKVQNIYSLIALILSIAIAVAAGLLHNISLGVQILSTTLLVAMPASFFIALTRPMAVLERRLHALGTVLCGWKGVLGLSGKYLYPIRDEDLFPAGSVKMNGVKFYGDRDPETVIAYAASLMKANGGNLAPIFEQLLSNRNGVRFEAQNVQFYGNGGIGGEINGDPVLMGTLEFLKEMGVEIPDGTMVKEAVYVSVDGDLSGLFAINYNRMKHAVTGMATICSSRRVRPVIIARDFLMTSAFLKEKFAIRPRRTLFPSHAEQLALAQKQADPESPTLALTTQGGLASVAYAITGAGALRTACRMGLTVHMIGGILGMLIMAALAVLGTASLLAPVHILLYQLIWLIPGWIVTMWTRAI